MVFIFGVIAEGSVLMPHVHRNMENYNEFRGQNWKVKDSDDHIWIMFQGTKNV